MRAVLISAIPVLHFLNKNSYPVYLPEAFLLWVLIFAGFWAVQRVCRQAGMSWIFYGLTLAFYLDFFVGSGRLALAVFLAVCLLRERVARIFLTVSWAAFAFVLILGFLNPTFLYSSRASSEGQGSPAKKPHIFVFILDEHGGLVDYPDIAKDYVNKGFQVFPRAYSNYNAAWASIGSLLNASTEGRQVLMEKVALKQNRLLEGLSREGYPVYIYQNPHVDFSQTLGFAAKKVFKYQEDSVGYLAGLPVSLHGKVWVLFNNFIESSRSKTAIKILRRFHRPENRGLYMTGALAIRRILQEMEADTVKEKNGGIFFAHIHNPHSHYVYKASGALLDPLAWEPCHSVALDNEGTLNTTESRIRKHALAAGQIGYLHKVIGDFMDRLNARGLYEDSTFVFISNYGSHIYRIHANARNRDRLTLAEYKDGYSVLLAIKNGGYNKEWPVNQGGTVQSMTPASLVLADYFHFPPKRNAEKEALHSIYLPTEDPFEWVKNSPPEF